MKLHGLESGPPMKSPMPRSRSESALSGLSDLADDPDGGALPPPFAQQTGGAAEMQRRIAMPRQSPIQPRWSPHPRSSPGHPRSSPALGRYDRPSQPLLGVSVGAIVMVYLVNFMDSLGGNISTPILPFYGKEFGASSMEIGELFSVFALAQTAATPLLGALSDRYGRRRVLLLSLLGCGFGAMCQGMAFSYGCLFAARAFSGIWAGVGSVCQVYIVDVVPHELRAEYLGYLLSSTQASILFGPSLGAGLSVLGLNAPALTQAGVSFVLLPIVFYYLPESPEWLKVHNPAMSPNPNASPRLAGRAKMAPKMKNPGIGKKFTRVTILIYGVVAMSCMIAQMSVVSMFAIYAKEKYNLDSLRVGFSMTLGAIASIGTNIWLSPNIQRRIGNLWASVLGSVGIMVGALLTVWEPLPEGSLTITIAGLMVAYVGIAINAGAVATGAANLTDLHNRSSVMMGVRMMKSFGAMAGPIISGWSINYFQGDVRLPFFVAAFFGLSAALWQLATQRWQQKVYKLIEGRRSVGMQTPLVGEAWQDEFGSPEEIADLGHYVADLLTSRHYRWVTYNAALKNCLMDFFPELPIDSEEVHRQAYDYVRGISKEWTKVDSLEDEWWSRNRKESDAYQIMGA